MTTQISIQGLKMTSISVTRALTEIKHLSDRISRASSEPFIGIVKGKDTYKTCVNSPSSSVETITDLLKKNLQSVTDLIKRREELKRAVITSNAKTNVTIAGQQMTVAEAIEKKANIVFEQQLVQNMRNQFVTMRNKIDAENTKLYQEINNAVQQAYGNEKGKVDEDQYNAVANPRLARSELSFIDPSKLEETIKSMETKIYDFMSEVDFTLSESNSSTLISVN